MKVNVLKTNPRQYSSNSYLILGNWNKIDDVNTVVDPGIDGYILNGLSEISTGVGKRAIEQVLLTHTHFDHAAGLPEIYQRFKPKVWSFTEVKTSGKKLIDGQLLPCGDDFLEVIHTPYHSNDSVCFLNHTEGILFSGDIPLVILGCDGSYPRGFLEFMHRLIRLDIRVIYPGHGGIILRDIRSILKVSVANMERSIITE